MRSLPSPPPPPVALVSPESSSPPVGGGEFVIADPAGDSVMAVPASESGGESATAVRLVVAAQVEFESKV